MILSISIGIVSILIALNGLLYQPKKDPSAPATWSNINRLGKYLFALILLINLLNVSKSIYDSQIQSKEVTRRDTEIRELIESQKQLTNDNNILKSKMEATLMQQIELSDTNRHLIKVMSVADGYNAIIRGTVQFRKSVSDKEIRNALNNLFLKYAEARISASNQLGTYTGRIDYAAHPEVRKFLALSQNLGGYIADRYRRMAADSWDKAEDEYLKMLITKRHMPADSYYFEIRCSKLKILNKDKIQYARFQPNERLDIEVMSFAWSRDFGRLYNVSKIYIDEIEIEELQKKPINQMLLF